MYNPYIVIPFATWFIAQFLKFSLKAFSGRTDWRLFYTSGGMPSAHGAVASSLAITAGLLDGFSSHIFGLTIILAAIVMYDSLGVRRASGEQAVRLNELLSYTNSARATSFEPVREVLGHQPQEVAAGAILGVVLAAIFNYEQMGWLTSFMTTAPQWTELLGYALASIVVLLASIILFFGLRRSYRKSASMRAYSKQLLSRGQVFGWLGLVSCFAIYEKAGWLVWRMWPILVLVMALSAMVWTLVGGLRLLPPKIAKEMEVARKSKWFEPKSQSHKRARRR
jgi:uncharacterized protein